MNADGRDSSLAWKLIFLLTGIGNLANGLWMLADPPAWYYELPAAVPDFGPLNEHFIRDLGAMFATFGSMLVLAAFLPAVRFGVALVLACWYVVHALVHVYDTFRGMVGNEHYLIDLPLVYIPALIFAAMAYRLRPATGGGS